MGQRFAKLGVIERIVRSWRVCLTSALHALCRRVDGVRQRADDTQLWEEGDAARSLELRGGTGQVRSDPGQRDLRGVGLEDHQVSLQLFEGEAALLVETSGREGRKSW